jgi:Catechol dioxygenase N terminus
MAQKKMDPSKADKIPVLKDLTADNITENVVRINSQCDDVRLKYITERLVTHLHDFARETRLSTQEWEAGIRFLTDVGKKCSDVRQVFLFSVYFNPSLKAGAVGRESTRDRIMKSKEIQVSLAYRNSSYFLISLVSLSSSTPLTTQSLQTAPRELSWDPFMRMRLR